MLAGNVPKDDFPNMRKIPGEYRYTSTAGSITIRGVPWHIEIGDATGKLLTATDHADDNSTSSSRPSCHSRLCDARGIIRAVLMPCLRCPPEKKSFGYGESFTGLDKRGQKIVLWTDDANGIENQCMYKPIPFFHEQPRIRHAVYPHVHAYYVRFWKFIYRTQNAPGWR